MHAFIQSGIYHKRDMNPFYKRMKHPFQVIMQVNLQLMKYGIFFYQVQSNTCC
ncbi:hypothetical protein GYH30_005709 [Glycine max]|uniref:Uncharacterized protein n=1 Tax=Glycine max TaxID=3847 RepID=A0A0R0LAK6_SOYBN|nr:hypothetical protein GYH30_005709 [Glycine max]